MVRFHPAVQTWFEQQYADPSPPQKRGWPSIASGQNTLILAPTGSGKTLAAFLWCIDHILQRAMTMPESEFARNQAGVLTLYISPLKALNNDIHRNLQEPLRGIRKTAHGPFPEIRALVRTGDTPPRVRQAMLRRPPHILITTPESLYLLLTSARARELFRALRYVIVDEIHALCASKRGAHLSLSLERLTHLCAAEPVRIGLSATQRPLERVAAFLGGQHRAYDGAAAISRPVKVIDCGRGKKIDLRVTCPVEDFSALEQPTVWPDVIRMLYDLINAHASSLIFVNTRSQTERIARQINDLHRERSESEPSRAMAAAHHGSLSREQRYVIEDGLKRGEIPAVIATASLELGIDIGAIDLVVQIQSPMRVSAGLQRVGRSGHTLRATSKGRLIPLFPADLDDMLALAECMVNHDIEETTIPENCLDVLAQQIVAEVAMQGWSRLELFALFRQSYCYRGLSINLFDAVLRMLSGRYADGRIRELRPQISWDQVNDMLAPMRGARLSAILQGGTIPDRGYYGIYLQDSSVKLGEIDEEFVFESRVGDVFFLGNNEWRIEQITHDRLLVTPVSAVKPREPFWKGEALYRDFGTAMKIAGFRRRTLEHLASGTGEAWLAETVPADAATIRNTMAYLGAQLKHCGRVAHDRAVVVECFHDAAGEPLAVIHAPFGARVNGAWAAAMTAQLERQTGTQVQHAYDDDGIILRLLSGFVPEDIAGLCRLDPAEAKTLLVEKIPDTPAFVIAFRHNAGRALLLQRSRAGRRVPLWLQRLRTADLLQVVRNYPDFPILLETYRDCLQDVYDVSALSEILARLASGDIEVHCVHTASPSPMASGLVRDFLSQHLYQEDRARFAARGYAGSSDLLADLFSEQIIPPIVTAALVKEQKKFWQVAAPTQQARSAEELFIIIEKLGPIDDEALRRRSMEPPSAWLQELKSSGRIHLRIREPKGWLTQAHRRLFSGKAGAAVRIERVRRYLMTQGPVTLREIAASTGVPAQAATAALQTLKEKREAVSGRLLQDDPESYWCDATHFAGLYRKAIGQRRQQAGIAEQQDYYRFLLLWHNIGSPIPLENESLARYAGFRFPLRFIERELLAARTSSPGSHPAVQAWKDAIARGDFVLYADRPTPQTRASVWFLPRTHGSVFWTRDQMNQKLGHLSASAADVAGFLAENGASAGRDIIAATGVSALQAWSALCELAQNQLVSCEDVDSFVRLLHQDTKEIDPAPASLATQESPYWRAKHGRRPGRREIGTRATQRMSVARVHWFLTTNFAAFGRDIGAETQELAQTRLLLDRYGILVKEWYRREASFLPWYRLFQNLKRLEWQGEIRRGYFVRGLSGVQFARPEALEMLERLVDGSPPFPVGTAMLSTLDPALPFGGSAGWGLRGHRGNDLPVIRAAGHHLVFVDSRPVAYCENHGARIHFIAAPGSAAVRAVATGLKQRLAAPAALRARKKMEIETIDGQPAAQGTFVGLFTAEGFEIDGTRLVLWPSKL